MKITIDNINKTLEIDQDVKIEELIAFVKSILPNWEEYKIVATKYIYNGGTSPTIYPWYPDVTPVNPYNPPWTITCKV